MDGGWEERRKEKRREKTEKKELRETYQRLSNYLWKGISVFLFSKSVKISMWSYCRCLVHSLGHTWLITRIWHTQITVFHQTIPLITCLDVEAVSFCIQVSKHSWLLYLVCNGWVTYICTLVSVQRPHFESHWDTWSATSRWDTIHSNR